MLIKRARLYFFGVAISVIAAATAAPRARAIPGIADSLGLSPFWNYKTIETPHFRITFPRELSATAERTANYLEEANSLLSPALYWRPLYRVNVLVIDNTDLENGLTSATLRFGMTLFVTPPDDWSSIAYYDNWLRELCIHEYTHFLNMDATRDFYKPLRVLFGDLLLPNSLWPRWMLEGLAVYDETRYTRAGRGRSPYYDMILRAAVEEHVLDSRKFITLDKVNGPNPWYPGGETAYVFGYELMNQVTQDAKPGPTADGQGTLLSGQDALGVMSKRSSARVPYFINGNLENITGKSWYDVWRDFVAKTRAHAEKQLATIRSQPVTRFKRLTSNGYEIYGPQVSPDGNWIAYTQSSLDNISGLYLRNRKTGKVTRLLDKAGGVSLSFTNDSRYLFESRLHRIRTFYEYSDLEVLNLSDGSTHWLTWRQRARDPSLSPDDRQVAFTRTTDTKTELVVGKLQFDGNRFSMGPTRVLFSGEKFDRVSNPRFSPSGRTIAFSFHHNGTLGEDLLVINVANGTVRTLVHDGHLNRYPVWDPGDQLYYVSDKTGVDNLYRYPGIQLSNMETGIAFPDFSRFLPKGHCLATVFSTRGWDLAEVTLPERPYDTNQLIVAPPDAPAADQKSMDHAGNKNYPIHDYSIWPTILPRTWSPLLQVTNQGVYAGGEITGFDQVDRHRYVLVGAYDSLLKKGDFYGVYDNRTLGPTLEAAASIYTNFESTQGNTLVAYGRTQNYSLATYFPFQFTYSSFTPKISYNFQRQTDYAVPGNGGPDVVTGQTALVPNVDGSFVYSDALSSPLAIASERGRTLFGGARAYMDPGNTDWKGLLGDTENIELGNTHVVFAPSLKGSWVSHYSDYAPADVLVEGRQSGIIDPIAATDFDQLGIHGYPLQAFYTRAAAVADAELKFPVWRIFAGPGTDPLFLKNLYGFAFGEATYFPARDVGVTTLPSAGTGLNLGVDVAQYVPLTFTVEYDKGFRSTFGGEGDLFFQMGVQAALP